MTEPPHISEAIGGEIYELIARLFPMHRSMTGDGVRETLKVIGGIAPVTTHEVPSGTEVFDWQVPLEWNVSYAYIKDSDGKRIVDFGTSNLHLVNGSCPVNQTLSWSELKGKLHTLPRQPDVIPYRTCFHQEDWGFCISQSQFDHLDQNPDAQYEVVINSDFKKGSLSYGEIVMPGRSEYEVLLSAHICHPSLANDNLSGLAVAAFLARELSQQADLRYTYRIVMAPATIGAITWLARNEERLPKIKHGLVLSLLGDPGPITYKQSRNSDARINRVVEQVLRDAREPYQVRSFEPFGYDERQYCSPGIDLPMGCLMRTPSGEFDEYHTSNDNLDFVRPEFLKESFDALMQIIFRLENDAVFINSRPNTEPRLDRYGLYEGFPVDGDQATAQKAVQWILNLSDGNHSLADITEISGASDKLIKDCASQLEIIGLLKSL